MLPDGCTYAGLDVSGDELRRAAPGAYDEILVGDICERQPATEGRFDLVISWQVLEHVPSMRAALATKHAALVPGGRMVSMLSGAWAMHALAARVIPYRLSTWLQARLLGMTPEDKFPTRYDCCTDGALRKLLDEGGWNSWEVMPLYRSGIYLEFSRPLQPRISRLRELGGSPTASQLGDALHRRRNRLSPESRRLWRRSA